MLDRVGNHKNVVDIFIAAMVLAKIHAAILVRFATMTEELFHPRLRNVWRSVEVLTDVDIISF